MLCLLCVLKCAARDADLRLRSGSPVGHSASVGDAFGVVVDKTEENDERRSERAASRRLSPASLASVIR